MYTHHMFEGGFFGPHHLGFLHLGPLAVLAFLAVLAVAVVVVAALVAGRHHAPHHRGGAHDGSFTSSATRILDERYARGEIDDEEYQRRGASLRASRGIQ
jgi:putative membrane protein